MSATFPVLMLRIRAMLVDSKLPGAYYRANKEIESQA